MSPSEYILRKSIVASSLSSGEWQSLPAAIKDRAFFSSRVESVRFLDTARSRIADLLDNARLSNNAPTTSRAQVVSDIMRAARDAGISSGSGSLSDPGSEARANVIIDTNAGLAAGYSKALISNSLGARLAFPAQELLRIEQRNVPRDWLVRWRQAGGRLFNGRMIALKEDPVWLKISRFSLPYPPFDFNSGMGVEDVSRDDAISIGLIQPDYTPPPSSPIDDFNNSLQADIDFKNDVPWQHLKSAFGDQIRVSNGKISWRHHLIEDAILSNQPFAIRLGSPTPDLLSALPPSIPVSALQGKQLVITQDWLDNKRPDGSDHRSHFYPLEADPRNIPLSLSDIELLPEIWRRPDSVQLGASKHRLLLSLKANDDSIYRAVIDFANSPRLVTFYKNKPL